MSYCRWSSDNFHCDLYCYEHVCGFYQIEVATHRYLGDIPEVPDIGSVSAKEYAKKCKEQHEFLETTQRERIGLPYDGQSFSEPNLEAFLARLLELRKVGYRFPDYVLDEVRDEIRRKERRKTKIGSKRHSEA